MTDDDALLVALTAVQERGAIGAVPLVDAVAHAEQFVRVVPADARLLADLGSGGGLPGLVIAVRCGGLAVVLVERRRTRADLLRRAVSALDLGERVSVHADDVRSLVAVRPRSFDVVTARSFAAPAVTARWGSALLRPGGLLVVSEPPDHELARWPAEVLARHGLEDLGRDRGIRRFCAR